jgi:hypothetical protein
MATWKLPSSPRKKKLLQDRSKGMAMLELFFGSSETVHMEFIPEGATVNKHRCKDILHHLCNSACCKCPEVWQRKNWQLLHDNSPAHRSVLVQAELAKQRVTVLPHPPYSSDLPSDFFFFSHLKEKLRSSISVNQGICDCHKGGHMVPSCKYRSAVFSAALPMLADLHSDQR